MALAAQRAYSDAVRWIRESRAGLPNPGTYAWRAFGGTVAVGIGAFAVVGLVSPGVFGERGTGSFDAGWPTIVLVVLAVVVVGFVIARRDRVAWLAASFWGAFRHQTFDDRAFEGAVGALSSCPGPFRTRFAVGWVWGPALVVGIAGMLALAASYFAVDAILARGDVGWGQPLTAGVDTLLSLTLFRLGARRAQTWQLAASVHRSVTESYA